ncbi:MAG: glycosyltransferase, partial [Clostridia bacterium]|nr:glycosyltransferase [Clostridia bacterium]
MTSTLVMVTYNRLSLLKQTLQAHLEMTVPFDDIVIVNNCSTDGTYEYLENVIKTHARVHVLHSKINAGGAGGFATGMAYALENL